MTFFVAPSHPEVGVALLRTPVDWLPLCTIISDRLSLLNFRDDEPPPQVHCKQTNTAYDLACCKASMLALL